MILGLGSDIIEIERIEKAIARRSEHFLDRLFTPSEQVYCSHFGKESAPRYAGRFAAKEAVAKALGTGIGSTISWLDIEILNDDKGKPIVNIAPHIALRMGIGNPNILVSISHCKAYATATALWINSNLPLSQ